MTTSTAADDSPALKSTFVAGCVAANVAFAQLAAALNGLLFLDTVGTAVAALRLGPWWGMFVGISTNTLLSTMPCKQQYFNYLIVNAVCGLVWGVAGRSVLRFFKTKPTYAELIFKVLLIGGISGLIASAIALFTTFNFVWRLEDIDPATFREWHMTDRYYRWLLSSGLLDQNGTLLEVLKRDVIAILPDKIVSVAVAVMIVYYMFPRSEMQLRSIERWDFLNDRTGAVVATLALAAASLVLFIRGQVSIDTTTCTIVSYAHIPAQRWLWVALTACCAGLTLAALKRPPSRARGVNPTKRKPIVKMVYRDVMTILAGLFGTLIALTASGRDGSGTSELGQIAFLLSEGFGVLAFFAVMAFLPGFLLRLFSSDPEVHSD